MSPLVSSIGVVREGEAKGVGTTIAAEVMKVTASEAATAAVTVSMEVADVCVFG